MKGILRGRVGKIFVSITILAKNFPRGLMTLYLYFDFQMPSPWGGEEEIFKKKEKFSHIPFFMVAAAKLEKGINPHVSL